MKHTFTIILTIIICGFSSSEKKCIKGNIEYSIATYTDEFFLKPQYQKILDSLFQEPVYDFFCNQKIKNLPSGNKIKSNKNSPSQKHIIEPLFIDLTNFNGIYGKRIFYLDTKIRIPKFRCGFHHYIFIISNNEYIGLTEDTIKNSKLIRESLRTSFTENEISRMTEYYKYEMVCDDYTFIPSTLVKKNNVVLFDASKE
jgi:hypothetical protein